ncbi:cation diffusion facilitator family transporter [bacterium]|nr:cation diffusion facilitator family transporter [bacterium]
MTAKAFYEQNALKVSMFGTTIFIILGFGFAILTDSNSILFDGIYSLIAFSISILTLKVAKLAEKPDDDMFHFGYTQFEPLINVFKSLFILAACVFALTGAIRSILKGGHPMELGFAVVYGVLATGGCFAFGFYLHHIAKKHQSGLVQVDVVEWLIDGSISMGILIGFAIAYGLELIGWKSVTPYVDPILLIIISIVSLPFPVKVLLNNMRELVAMAPPESVIDDLDIHLKKAIQDVPLIDYEFRVLKQGRNTFLLVHLIVSDEFHIDSVEELDRIREGIDSKMIAFNPEITMEVLFIKDKAWAELK